MINPHLGLVCITSSDLIRYKTITRTRYLSLSEEQRSMALRALYAANIATFEAAIKFCAENLIFLYRMPSSIFPMADTPDGLAILQTFAPQLANLGRLAEESKIRVVAHPDQFVVLSSDSESTIENSITVLVMHAQIFDMMGLPDSPWTALTLHGGKRGNSTKLCQVIQKLPSNIRNRLTLENDEISYSVEDILAICKVTGVPMIFDAHHHLILEKCPNYEDPSMRKALEAARQTWRPNEDWQLVHISNGDGASHNRRHSDYIEVMPSCYRDVSWIEIEARGKDLAIQRLREIWLEKPVAKTTAKSK
ncbi:MAG: UV DNA damage repair endonuclease UvsE [Leptolyngbya sp.]|nr:UV DNA damage repair endonuclease UvsE [Candidatus Melainabacteria bacterium]